MNSGGIRKKSEQAKAGFCKAKFLNRMVGKSGCKALCSGFYTAKILFSMIKSAFMGKSLSF
ncbi:MAG TPA: hypothetical protein DCM73_14680 [Clostridiales bacterium]|nr:hypothetical protein [Clostridiales bacterium]